MGIVLREMTFLQSAHGFGRRGGVFPAMIPEPEAEHPVQRFGPYPAAFLVEGGPVEALLIPLDSGKAVRRAELEGPLLSLTACALRPSSVQRVASRGQS